MKENGVQLASFGTDEIASRGRRFIRFSLLATEWDTINGIRASTRSSKEMMAKARAAI
jgi:hypothetical protein